MPPSLVQACLYTLLAFGVVFGVLVLALVVYQTQNLVQGVTSRERSLRSRMNHQLESAISQSEMNNAEESMVNSKMDDDQVSQAIFLKSIRSEKHDHFFRRQGTAYGMSEESTGQNSCFSNCCHMLCDHEK